MEKKTLKIYTKPNCCLCDIAKENMINLSKRFPIKIEEININSDERLYNLYKEEIPVAFVENTRLISVFSELQLYKELELLFK